MGNFIAWISSRTHKTALWGFGLLVCLISGTFIWTLLFSGIFACFGDGFATESFEGHEILPQSFEDLVQSSRLRLLHRGCEKLGMHIVKSPEKFFTGGFLKAKPYFLFDEEHRVGLKPVEKTGCTSWKLAMLNNTGKRGLEDEKHPVVNQGQKQRWVHILTESSSSPLLSAARASTREVARAMQKSFIILLVRHPFDRLESAYTDKVIVQKSHTEQILWKRPGITESEVQRLSKNGSNVGFLEFLDYALKEYNEHWSPIFHMVAPCNIQYGYIGKTETVSRDLNYIIRTKLSGRGQAMNLNRMRGDGNEDARAISLPLFSGIERARQSHWVERVAEAYRHDFDLFGYDYNYTTDGKIYGTCKQYDRTGMCL